LIVLQGENKAFFKTGEEVRLACRQGLWRSQTSGLAYGYVQANLVVLEKEWAWDFLVFAQRNPKPCPVLEVGEQGSYLTRFLARDGDIRTDLPLYRLYEYGVLKEETEDISRLWKNDSIFFLVGCSFSFEEALLEAGLEVRHITEGVNVPMYRTSIVCAGAGRFPETPMVVSMRPFSPRDAEKAAAITREFPGVHGGPVHVGDPEAIGIMDINRPDFGDRVTIKQGEVPVFWACGVTPQAAAAIAKPPVMITHAPGHMFVGDRRNHQYRI
jgi:uncharacterized protein YcsI (UPF0317 family)